MTTRLENVSTTLVKVLVANLIANTQGPSEAYATLCCAIIEVCRFNDIDEGTVTSIDDLCLEITQSLRSIGPLNDPTSTAH
jgi:hypothetical protein